METAVSCTKCNQMASPKRLVEVPLKHCLVAQLQLSALKIVAMSDQY